MTIKAVLFDFGDTLVHTERFDYNRCLRKMHKNLAKNGLMVPFAGFKRSYFDVRNRFYREAEKTLREQDFAQRIIRTLEPFGVKLASKDKRVQEALHVFMSAFVDSLRIDDYLPSLLEVLCKKYRLGVVSNMSFAEAGFKSLEKFDIARYFDTIIISGMVGWRKPSPKIFTEALKALEVKAEETVFVGDSPRADIEGAKQLGMKTVLVTGNGEIPSTDTFQLYINHAPPSNIEPDKKIKELAQLPEALKHLEQRLKT